MRNRELKNKLQALEARIANLEWVFNKHRTDLDRNLGEIQHKLNSQSRALDRLLRYSAQATGIEARDEAGNDNITWSD